ncbi:hypothetical protein AB9N12_10865 [Bacteroides sp. AN502(2024)]|uniref:hypothetical protein n=1 Tax=Bacteroides sp. AN502(2024) TaxID=3160599 RepID=UPI00351652E8
MEYITTAKVKRLFTLMSRMVSFTLNLTDLGREIEAPHQTVLLMLYWLHLAALIYMLYNEKNNLGQLSKPEKVYLENANLRFPLSGNPDTGNVRETFFANQLKESHEISYSGTGDFLIDGQHVFKVGAGTRLSDKSKTFPTDTLPWMTWKSGRETGFHCGCSDCCIRGIAKTVFRVFYT